MRIKEADKSTVNGVYPPAMPRGEAKIILLGYDGEAIEEGRVGNPWKPGQKFFAWCTNAVYDEERVRSIEQRRFATVADAVAAIQGTGYALDWFVAPIREEEDLP